MQSQLILGSIAAFLIGVGWRTVQDISMAEVVWLLVLALGLMMVVRGRRSFASSATHLLTVSLCLTFLALGILRTEVASWQFNVSALESLVGESVTLQGIVTSELDYRERTVQFKVETDSDIVLVSADRLSQVDYGDLVSVIGKIERPTTFTTDLGRTFDYPSYLKVQGVEYKMSFVELKVAGSDFGNPVISRLLTAKKVFIKSLQNIIPEPAVGLGVGLLLGVKASLGDDIEEDFRRTGIIHIVVLSGYNVMLVVAFIMYCLSFFLPLRIRIISGVVAIIAFASIVGFSATVVRASIMAVLVLLAQVMGRRYDVTRALLLAGVMMILFNPYILIYDIGFQLSFMATLGLVLAIPAFESDLLQGKNFFGWKEFLLSTVATQIAVLPLLMYHIGQISLIAVVVNMLVLPAVPFAMLLTFLAGILGFVSDVLAGLVGYLATLTLNYILAAAHFFAQLPLAAVTVPQFSATGVFVMYIGMIMVWCWFKKRDTTKNEFSDWVIEEEGEVREEVREVVNVSSEEVDDLPIFFR